MAVEFYIHKMSEHMDAAEIIQWLVKEGDRVEQHQPLVEVMTDKFTVEVEAPVAGIFAGRRAGTEPGQTVPVGEALAFIVQPGERAPSLPPIGSPAQAETPAPEPAPAAPSANGGEEVGRVRSTPVARRMAKELGVDIEQVRGSGPGGRVTEQDVRAFAQHAAAPVSVPEPPPIPQPIPPAPPAGAGFTWQELTPIQRITGERMAASVTAAPQFAVEMSADATNLLWLRDALMDRILLDARTRLSVTALLVKIAADVLGRHPRANAEYDGGRLKLHEAINVGVAVGTEQGLAVPVVKDARGKSLAEVAAALDAFQEKARTLHFSADDLGGGTFTLSNLGMFGVERFQAILNPPQSAILAVGAVVRTPVVLANDTVAVRPMMRLALTVDHRVLDGVQAARFLADLKDRIEKPYFLI
jgi:pyruvate dehydrogenase E2 component (dihydrolipoamide acetyltransferase)